MTPEKVAQWREALGGRRFLMCMGCAFINTILFAIGFPLAHPMTEGGYLMILGGTVFTFVSANTTEKFKAKPAEPT